jgi:hypothetical protein
MFVFTVFSIFLSQMSPLSTNMGFASIAVAYFSVPLSRVDAKKITP